MAPDNPSPTLPTADDREKILCVDRAGELRTGMRRHISIGVAVYGLLLEQDRVLMKLDQNSGLILPPGGDLSSDQPLEKGLRQLFRAATGLPVEIGLVILLDDVYQWAEQRAVHLQRFFYLVHRQRNTPGAFIDYDNPARPQWVKLDKLERSSMLLGYQAVLTAAACGA